VLCARSLGPAAHVGNGNGSGAPGDRLRRRWDLAAAALIGLVLCLTLAAVAAHTPVRPVLASTVGYTLWWGSMCGMWVWLILGWAVWIALFPRVRKRGRALATVAGLAAVAAAGTAVAAGEKPDQHVALYGPLARIAARLDRTIQPGSTVRLEGTLDSATLPFKPAVRFFLARRGVRALSRGAYLRNGGWYELYRRPYDRTLELAGCAGAPARACRC